MIYYFLTIDQCRTIDVDPPTIDSYAQIMGNLSLFNNFREIGHLNCFEYKTKKYNGMIYNDWLHYHTVITAKQFISYDRMRIKGYSIVLKLLRNHYDVIKVSNYICKNKVDSIY